MNPQTFESYTRLRESAAWFPVTDDALIELTGEDRIEWLQGQCTNDLRKLKSNEPFYCCICTPTGQLAAPCTVYELPDRLLIVTPKLCAPAVLERVETMVIMEDVQARELTAEYDWISIQGPSAADFLRPWFEQNHALVLPSDRTGSPGFDLLAADREAILGVRVVPTRLQLDSASDQLDNGDAPEVRVVPTRLQPYPAADLNTTESLDIARLEAGIPIFGRDMTEKTLPPEMGPAFEAKYISYTKGCYTGQEVLMRIHSRGHTNKTWMALIAEAPLQPGDTISHPSRQDAGTITSAAISPTFGFIAGAMLRNEATQEGDMVNVHTADRDVRAVVGDFPIWG